MPLYLFLTNISILSWLLSVSHFLRDNRASEKDMGFLYFIFSLLIFLAFSGLPTVRGNSELTVLMEIKASLDPENRFLSSWTSDADPCSDSFEGVHCNQHQKVANITLQGKGLTGKIPAAVAGLKCLSGLYLHYNSLSGEIPREISGLSELSDLYLDYNRLSGVIPPEIGNMASLEGWSLRLRILDFILVLVNLNFLIWDLMGTGKVLDQCLFFFLRFLSYQKDII